MIPRERGGIVGIFFIFHLISTLQEGTEQSTPQGGTEKSTPQGSTEQSKGELVLVNRES